MTPPSDDLRQLWFVEAGGGREAPELLRELERTASRFDRTIRFRDLRETAAGVLAAAVFIWLAVHDRTPLERAAHLWLAACGVWIAFYLRRYSKASRRPAPEQSLAAYRRELLARYDRQIRLLSRARYWYILPFWAGLVFSALAGLARSGDRLLFGAAIVWASAVSAVLWWLNEGIGVRHLRNRRRQLEGAPE